MVRPSRRRRAALLVACVLIGSGLGAGSASPTEASHPSAFSRPLVIPRVLTGSNITLTAAAKDVRMLPGALTRMWTCNGTFPGPTIRRPAGQTTTVTLVNKLPGAAGELTLHNHGNHSTSENDGQPDAFLAAPAGGSVTTPTAAPRRAGTSGAPSSGTTTIGWT